MITLVIVLLLTLVDIAKIGIIARVHPVIMVQHVL